MRFEWYNGEHVFWLSWAVLTTALAIWLGRRDARWRDRVAWVLAWLPPLAWVGSTLVIGPMYDWYLDYVLPLHLCYMLGMLTPVLLVRRNQLLFELAWFWVMAGCIQALFTPDLRQGFPHPFSVRYWLVHIGLVQCWLYAALVLGMRPTWRSILRSLLALDLYVLVVYGLNFLLGTNFLFLREPPKVPTMLDYLGPFPWFLLTGQVVALALFTLVYLPFALGDWRARRMRLAANEEA